MLKLIALDLDGTLLGGTQPHYGILPEALEAMRAATEQGVFIGIASGRELDFMEQLFPDHQVDPGRDGFPKLLMPDERYLYLLKHSEYEPAAAWNDQIEAKERGCLADARTLVSTLWEELQRIDPRVRLISEEAIRRRGFIELYFSSREAAETAAPTIQAYCEAHAPDLQPIRNGGLIALRHREVGKGQVLLDAAHVLGLLPDQVLAVGDSANDQSMLDGRFGFQAATVANAEPVIKDLVRARGGYVAQRPYGAGVAEIIYRALHSSPSPHRG